MDDYIVIGRIKVTIARCAHIKAAYVTIDKKHVQHIARKHKDELEQLGIGALDYVQLIVDRFGEIWQNKDQTILLVKRNYYKDCDTATLELTLDNHHNRWEVKTAQPHRNLNGKKLLWKRRSK